METSRLLEPTSPAKVFAAPSILEVAWLRRNTRLTVAGQRRFRTGFPSRIWNEHYAPRGPSQRAIMRQFRRFEFGQKKQFPPAVVVSGRLLSAGGFVPSKLFFVSWEARTARL